MFFPVHSLPPFLRRDDYYSSAENCIVLLILVAPKFPFRIDVSCEKADCILRAWRREKYSGLQRLKNCTEGSFPIPALRVFQWWVYFLIPALCYEKTIDFSRE